MRVNSLTFCFKLLNSAAVKLTAFGSYPQTEQYFNSMFTVCLASKEWAPELYAPGMPNAPEPTPGRRVNVVGIRQPITPALRLRKNCFSPSFGPPVWTNT